METFNKVAVLGSGVMGAGIAAHLANAGLEVLLLDQSKDQVKKALEAMKKASPAPLTHPSRLKQIHPGDFETDLEKLSTMDWVIEAIIEDLDIKRTLYKKLETTLGGETIISSNTSTLALESLTEGRRDAFKNRFFITHFFNPPRYMPLLEIVKGPNCDAYFLNTLVEFCDRHLGKTVVVCHDTPGFIANRIGTYWIQTAVSEAFEQDLSVEEVDQLLSRPLGIPKSGVFGLIDLVGLDIIPLVGKSLKAALPPQDLYVQEYKDFPIVQKLIEQGYTGRKGKGGFYRLNKEGDKKVKEAINLKTEAYTPAIKKVPLESLRTAGKDLKALLSYPDKGGKYVWTVLSKLLVYTAEVAETIADDIYRIDLAMKRGYNWRYGPFELLDRLGVSWFIEKMEAEGRSIPPLLKQAKEKSFYRIHDGQQQFLSYTGDYQTIPRAEGQVLLSDIKLSTHPLLKNPSAALWDIGDGVCCFEFTSKSNTIDPYTLELLDKSIDLVGEKYKALVIHNEGENFSVGANIGLALYAANLAMWEQIEELVAQGQTVLSKMKYAPFPVVVAPSGMTLGGGCECALHADAIQAHIETYIGLVEVGVGLIPAWGGCTEMLKRWMENAKGFGGPMGAVSKVFEMIGKAQVAKSAEEAQDFKILRETDGITMNKDRLLADAKTNALSLCDGYKPPPQQELSLPGKTARIALDLALKNFVMAGLATKYDEVIAKELGVVLSGGEEKSPLSETAVRQLERQSFMRLIPNLKTLDRIESIILTNKPLRN